jgi:hypothetical protein
MPPLVSKLVDEADVAKVKAWITALPHGSTVDAGTDGGQTSDAGTTLDSGPIDAGAGDASDDASGAGD